MKQKVPFLTLLLTVVMLLVYALPVLAAIPQPFRILGSVTIDGVTQTAVIPNLRVTLTKADGTLYQANDGTGTNVLPATTQTISVVSGNLLYHIDVPIFDAIDQTLGAVTGAVATIHLDTGAGTTAYNISVPAAGAFTVGASGAAATTINLTATTPPTVPGAPVIVSATPGNAQASVTFTAPGNGNSAITGYTVTPSPAGGTDSNAGSTSLTHIITGLTNGTAYTFTVKATNAIGTGAASAPSASVIPVTTPGAPTGAVAVRGNTQATVSFVAPVNTGGTPVTGYTVFSNPSGGTDSNIGSTSLSHVVTGLTNGTSYTFSVRAANAVGTGSASIASAAVIPATTPDAPAAPVAVKGDSQATVSFSAPASTGGSAITGYTVVSIPAGGTDTGAGSLSLSHTVTGLTNGTSYTFTVAATNAVGSSAPSAASAAVIPAGAPSAPTLVSAVRGNAQATVSFTAPTNNGGSAISGYTVVSSPAGGIDSNSGTLSLSHLVTGLTNGTAYTFTVVATNAAGPGAASAPSAAVTPATVPDAPATPTAVRGNAQAVVSFSAAANGGSPVTGYTVTSSPAGGIDGAAGTTALSHTITGLTNGTAYTFTVVAANAIGSGLPSAPSAAVTPATTPAVPTGVSAVGSNAQAIVSFTASATTGGSAITGYTVTSIPGGITASGAASPITITGLANGTSYTFTVSANNAVGASLPSAPSASVIPATVPGAATAVVAVPGNALAVVSFTAPFNGGSAITSYTVTTLPGNTTTTTTASPVTVSGLTNGTSYTFTVTATNVLGSGAVSAPSAAVVPAAVPDAPTAVTAVASPEKATVSFTPGFDGGHAVSGYTVVSIPAGGVDTNAGSTSLSHLVTGLTDATAYTFTVTATSSVGTSPVSAESNSVTPYSATAPALVVSALLNGAITNNATLNVSGTVTSANHLAVVNGLTINGTPVTVAVDGKFSTATTLVTGPNVVTLVATDGSPSALTTTDVRTITLDTSVPVVSNLLPVDNSITKSLNVTVSGTVSETSVVKITLNGGTPALANLSVTNFTLAVGPLTEGINTILVSATDQAGNTTAASDYKITVHLDTLAPALAITEPAQDIQIHTNATPVTIQGTVSDQTGTTIDLLFNGNHTQPTVTGGGFSEDITIPAEGTYPVVVTATDASGNSSAVTRNIIYTASPGDSTGNGGTTKLADLVKASQYVFSQGTLTPAELVRLDCAPLGSTGQPSPNGVVDAADIILLLRRTIGLVAF
jgi:hypothetical protein